MAMDMTHPAIEVRGLTKRYSGKVVLQDVNLTVARGEVLGYIGPNGAGKSTTVKILVGMLAHFTGEARVAGIDVRAQPVELKRHIGYVPENATLYESLTAYEYLQFVGRLHDLADADLDRRIPELLAAFDLDTRMTSRLGSFSKGMRQKILLSSALLHDPEVLFLDEPLSGLDVGSTLLVKELMRSLKARGKTIFYCSHVMDVVERVCDRIAVLDHGTLAAIGTFEELSQLASGGSLEQVFATLTHTGGESEKVERLLNSLKRTEP